MWLPNDAVIPPDKLIKYLLVPRPKNDKARFLARAGFTQENSDDLEQAIRRQISEHEAFLDRTDVYGTFYRVEGLLYGPRGILPVITIWMQPHEEVVYRFITLKPAR